MAYATLEPFGSMVDDLRAGLAPAMTHNVNRGEEGRAIGPFDFYPWHEPAAAPVETPEELAARIRRELIDPHG